MRARVLPLRRRGVLLEWPRPESEWIEGNLRLATRNREMQNEVSVLELNEPQAAPGMKVLARLFCPELESLGSGLIRVRGLESVKMDPAAPPVGVVQLWLVELQS